MRIAPLREQSGHLQALGVELKGLDWPRPEADWINQKVGHCAQRIEVSVNHIISK